MMNDIKGLHSNINAYPFTEYIAYILGQIYVYKIEYELYFFQIMHDWFGY